MAKAKRDFPGRTAPSATLVAEASSPDTLLACGRGGADAIRPGWRSPSPLSDVQVVCVAVTRHRAACGEAAVQSAIKSIGGRLEAFYDAFGDDDVVLIAELPDNVSAAAITLTTGSTGLVNIRTTPLLTVDEVDKALEITAKYRPPGGK